MFCVVHVDYKVVGDVNNDQRSSPKSFLIRDDILGSLRGLRHPLQGHSWPNAIFYAVHVYYDVVFVVNHDQTMFYVVHVDYDVLSEVILDQTIL